MKKVKIYLSVYLVGLVYTFFSFNNYKTNKNDFDEYSIFDNSNSFYSIPNNWSADIQKLEYYKNDASESKNRIKKRQFVNP